MVNDRVTYLPVQRVDATPCEPKALFTGGVYDRTDKTYQTLCKELRCGVVGRLGSRCMKLAVLLAKLMWLIGFF
jgi:hypothetical protein